MFISMFLSIWINNVAITAMMMPVVDSLSRELLQERKGAVSKDNGEAEEAFCMFAPAVHCSRLFRARPCCEKDICVKSDEGSVFVLPPRKRTETKLGDKSGKRRIQVLLYLSVIYGANTGAIATITSAASNVVFKFVIEDLYAEQAPVDYALWLFFALPVAVISTALIFLAVWPVFFRCKRKPKDATAVMIPVVLLFMIPARPCEGANSPGLVTWKVVQAKLQWSVILLIGSGFAIAEAMRLANLGHLSPGVLMMCLIIMCSFMSELISNAGTVTVLLPVFAALAEDLQMNPLLFMIPATLASNFAFLLPVGTPANAIVYEHASLKVSDMVLPGLLIKTITLFTTVVVTFVLGDPIFGMFSEADWVSPGAAANLTFSATEELR
ncbi:hypothetical protein HPB48_009729 [Haemaphysalis longicornis]|uniref:Na+/dicarboxylate na+/tricarboxylate and phosphate transporter n=1 Tax=Haemaphysalis longicornis TaxID=44386 RepID=A0A9J6GML5_HAELO|nr:hypothetical protein HPB48_009729 [Haemaphysalis longicornis]